MKSLPNETLLLVHGHVVKDGLNGVRTLFVAADPDEVVLYQVQNLEALVCRAVR